MMIRSLQTSVSQCFFNPTLTPIHFGFSGQEPLQRARLHGGEKPRLDLGRISEHLTLSFTVGTPDGNTPFSRLAVGFTFRLASSTPTTAQNSLGMLAVQPAIGFFLSAAED